MARFRCLTRDSNEWHRAWEVVHNTRFPVRKPGPVQSDEFWQYMGSFNRDGKWQHEFRHRYHPATAQREFIHVDCADMSALNEHPYW